MKLFTVYFYAGEDGLTTKKYVAESFAALYESLNKDEKAKVKNIFTESDVTFVQ